MNKLGESYIQKINTQYNKVKSILIKNNIKDFENKSWKDSMFQEMLMRIGIEYRDFELEISNTKEIEKIVNSILMESYLKMWENYAI